MDDAQVQLLQLPVPDLLVHHPQGGGGLGGDDDAPGVAVDAVAQGGGKGVLPPGGPLLLLVQVRLDVGDECVHLLLVVGVDHHARALVQQQQVLVLVQDGEPGLIHPQKGVVRGGRIKKLIVNVKLEHVPLLQVRIPPGALPVALHPLEADVFLR